MPRYLVIWEIDDDDSNTPEEAALQALEVMRDPMSIATVFTVFDKDTGERVAVDTAELVDYDET